MLTEKFFIVKIKSKDAGKFVAPFLEVYEKIDDKWSVIDKCSELSFDITGVACTTEDFKGSKSHLVKIFYKDKNQEAKGILHLKLNLLTRGLLNSLINLNTFDDLNLSFYVSKKGDKTSYWPSLKQNGQKVPWAISHADLPKPKEFLINGSRMHDFTEVDNFFIKKVKMLSAKLQQD